MSDYSYWCRCYTLFINGLLLDPLEYIISENIETTYGIEGIVKEHRKQSLKTYSTQYCCLCSLSASEFCNIDLL